MIKAIIFDAFGVIVGKGFESTYRTAGGDPISDREFIDSTLAQANLGFIDDDEFNDTVAKKLNLTDSQWQNVMKQAELPDEKLLGYIKDLRKTYKTALLSNSNTGILENKIGRKWIEECFDEFIVSAEVGVVKPDPQIYKIALSRLGVSPEETVFIDDKSSFTDAAAELGIKTSLYRDFISMRLDLEAILSES